MDSTFNADINLDEDMSPSNDDCEIPNDYDNQKLFDVFETYLNKSDISDTESEPELSLNDHFYQLVVNRVSRNQTLNRSIGQISCLADIEKHKSISRKSSPNEDSDQSMADLTLPWNLNDMSEQKIIELINELEEEVNNKTMNCPELAANNMKCVFDQQILFLNQLIEESEQKFRNKLQESDGKAVKERVPFDQHIGKELSDLKEKTEKLAKLEFDLNVIKEISKN